jgi:ectoine hydroxylase-related dioxygenase (phytanoyl-CoA dioxygenase family)
LSNSEALARLSVPAGASAEELLATYDRHGAVLCRQLLPQHDLARIRGAVADVVRMEARIAGIDIPENGVIDIMQLEALDHDLAATVYDIVNSHPEVFRLAGSAELRRVADILVNRAPSNELVVSGFQLRMDLPGNESELLGWHRDCDYFPQFPSDGLVLWIPLHDIDEATGGVSVIPESLTIESLSSVQLEKHWPGRRKPHKVYEIADSDTALAVLAEPVRIHCRAGDALFFSLTSAHRSEPNRASQARWTLQYRYFPASSVARRKLDRTALSAR